VSFSIRSLCTDDFDTVHRAFNEAFGDYFVKMSLTPDQLREMLTRRGWVPEASVGAFEGQRMIGFVLNGIEGDRAYNSGTGVIPSRRRGGVARRLMEEAIPVVGGREYVLEVLERNIAAARLYESLRFEQARRFQCWSYRSAGQAGASFLRSIPDGFCDVEPSWQNSAASILRARDPYVILGDERGYAVVFPSNGDLPQLAVRRDARRRGVGRHLLDAAAGEAGKTLRILNVDDRDEGIAAFLEAAGAEKTVRQIEMRLRGAPRPAAARSRSAAAPR
jgi:ribosomal protein S18 acetylase RimI-like enzyme